MKSATVILHKKFKDKIFILKNLQKSGFRGHFAVPPEFCYRSATNLLQTTEKGPPTRFIINMQNEFISLLHVKST